MKTEISVPDLVFEAADDMAKHLGMSRSQFYTTALSEFIDSFNDEVVTQALNEVYSDSTESIDPVLMQMQIQTLPIDDW